MEDITKIKAKDIMSKNIISIEISQTLNNAISVLSNEKIHNMLIYENKRYAGIFGYKQLVRLYRRPPDDTKIKDFIIKPPLISEDTSIIDIVDIMYRLNYKILPVGDEKKITGVISERDVLKTIFKLSLLSKRKVEEFMTPNPITLFEYDTLGEAFTLFREQNVSRIPIIDKNKKLIGIIESLDLIKEISSKGQSGRDSSSSNIRNYNTPHAYIPTIISNHDIPVKSVMSTKFVAAKTDDMLTDKIKETIELDMTTIIITDDNNYLVGIVAPKDIIQVLAALKEREKLYVQTSGLDSIYSIDEFQKLEIHHIMDRTIKKISSVSKITNFTIHAKVYDVDGDRKKYSFKCKFQMEKDIVFVKDSGWDSIDTFAVLMKKVEKIALKKLKKHVKGMISKNRNTKHNILNDL